MLVCWVPGPCPGDPHSGLGRWAGGAAMGARRSPVTAPGEGLGLWPLARSRLASPPRRRRPRGDLNELKLSQGHVRLPGRTGRVWLVAAPMDEKVSTLSPRALSPRRRHRASLQKSSLCLTQWFSAVGTLPTGGHRTELQTSVVVTAGNGDWWLVNRGRGPW